MMMQRGSDPVEVGKEEMGFTLHEICAHCGARVEFIVELVEYGVIAPVKGADAESWSFDAWALARLQRALRLHRDLEINLPGLAISLDLLDEVQRLRQQVDLLDGQLKQLLSD
jgi:chaperone modulatory protein CbpM